MEPHQKEAMEASLADFGEAQVRVGGYSMWPFIKDGDVIYITSRPVPNYFARVAVFWAESQLIAHRITGRNNSKSGESVLRISADFSRNSTTFVSENELLGTVFQLKRGDKLTSKWVTPPLAYLAVFLSFFIKMLNFHKAAGH